MISDEQKNKLTPEQLVIAQKWEAEHEEAGIIFEKMAFAMEHGLSITELIADLEKTLPTICEHGRTIMLSCSECEEIEKIIRPDLFDEDGMRKQQEE